jgi:hypothetical protein
VFLLFGLLALAICLVAFTAGWLIAVASGTASPPWAARIGLAGALVALVWGLLHLRSARTFGPEIANDMRRRGLIDLQSLARLERRKTMLVAAIGITGTLLGGAGIIVAVVVLT